jgi:hypothetical protein
LLSNWLQAFRQKVGSHFSKGQNSHQIFPIEDIKTIIIENSRNNYPLTMVSNRTFGCVEEGMGGVSGSNGSQQRKLYPEYL